DEGADDIERKTERLEPVQAVAIPLVEVNDSVAHDDLPGLESDEARHCLPCAEDQSEGAEPLRPERAGREREIDETEERAHALAAQHPAGILDDGAEPPDCAIFALPRRHRRSFGCYGRSSSILGG